MDKGDLNNQQGITEAEFLRSYDAGSYDRPSVTVDMLIFTIMNEKEDNYRKLPEKSLKLLMIKRGGHPYKGDWALPGGFVSMDESLEDAAKRELKTETNVDDVYLEQLFTWGDVGRDPRTRVISCSYMALADSSSLTVKAGDDADDAAWFDVKYRLLEERKTILEKGFLIEKTIRLELSGDADSLEAVVKVIERYDTRAKSVDRQIVSSKGIAFDHALMIGYAVERLRNKIEYTDIAFSLMPELFTLTELQQVYEVILDKELLAAAFRRKIANMVTETNQSTRYAGHRPSKLYRYNYEWQDK
jgi:ADP-ribose pyrophosphatase YjhB (NUDIX family)